MQLCLVNLTPRFQLTSSSFALTVLAAITCGLVVVLSRSENSHGLWNYENLHLAKSFSSLLWLAVVDIRSRLRVNSCELLLYSKAHRILLLYTMNSLRRGMYNILNALLATDSKTQWKSKLHHMPLLHSTEWNGKYAICMLNCRSSL